MKNDVDFSVEEPTQEMVDQAVAAWAIADGVTLERAYRRECLRTLSKGMANREILQMCALGLSGEFGEFIETPGLPELGDVFWYLAVLCHALELGDLPADRPMSESEARDATGDAGLLDGAMAVFRICERVKKCAFHGRSVDESMFVLIPALDDLARVLSAICARFEWPRHRVLAWNVGKLRHRYPAGFQTLPRGPYGQ